MEGIREKIASMFLEEIKKDLKDDCDVSDSVDNFRKFIDGLAMESSLSVKNDELAKQQAEAEAVDTYVEEIGMLFQQPGNHQKELDEIFARMSSSAAKIASSALSAVNESDKHRNNNEVTSLLDIIKATRKYVKQAYLNAEVRHATPGTFYMDESLYLIMEASKELLAKMDSALIDMADC